MLIPSFNAVSKIDFAHRALKRRRQDNLFQPSDKGRNDAYLPPVVIERITPFAPCFCHVTTWIKAQVLMIGTILLSLANSDAYEERKAPTIHAGVAELVCRQGERMSEDNHDGLSGG